MKECEYSFVCPYGCPYMETPSDCRDKVKEDLLLALERMFHTNFSLNGVDQIYELRGTDVY